ncbi:hypothetical protein BDP27DRAFT_1427584 [Rhodocollybia butyracea]|uniref:BTB domain-containing protein n=1 Tax=Rhodocollybia butyracea TaxID=206335 RepID=A0A9P5U1T9_9AGAR|nr:hypothetical protein BDP27DRAFT_1427584 [Rhodocollybia butyracea]
MDNQLQGLVKSPRYFTEDGDELMFCAGNMLFQYPLSVLQTKSTFFMDLTHKRGVMLNTGPIPLSLLSANDFTLVLDYVWHECDEPPRWTINEIILLMKSARYLLMPRLGWWGLQRLLDEESPVSAVQRLMLSNSIPILEHQWIDSAVTELVMSTSPLSNLSGDELTGIGPVVIAIIGDARYSILSEQKDLASMRPASHDVSPGVDCTWTHHLEHCYRAWSQTWYLKVGRELLNPQKPLPIHQVVEFVERTDFGPGLRPQCKEMFLNNLLVSGILRFELAISAAATTAVIEYLKGIYMDFDVWDLSRTAEDD